MNLSRRTSSTRLMTRLVSCASRIVFASVNDADTVYRAETARNARTHGFTGR